MLDAEANTQHARGNIQSICGRPDWWVKGSHKKEGAARSVPQPFQAETDLTYQAGKPDVHQSCVPVTPGPPLSVPPNAKRPVVGLISSTLRFRSAILSKRFNFEQYPGRACRIAHHVQYYVNCTCLMLSNFSRSYLDHRPALCLTPLEFVLRVWTDKKRSESQHGCLAPSSNRFFLACCDCSSVVVHAAPVLTCWSG